MDDRRAAAQYAAALEVAYGSASALPGYESPRQASSAKRRDVLWTLVASTLLSMTTLLVVVCGLRYRCLMLSGYRDAGTSCMLCAAIWVSLLGVSYGVFYVGTHMVRRGRAYRRQ